MSVNGIELLLPNVTFPKPTEVASGVSVPACTTPVPLAAIVVGELVASLVIVREPAMGPPLVGANFTVKDVLCPAASVTGKRGLVTENPAPVMVACEIVTAAELAVTVTVFEALLPVVTFPNASEVALALSDPTAAAPVPES